MLEYEKKNLEALLSLGLALNVKRESESSAELVVSDLKRGKLTRQRRSGMDEGWWGRELSKKKTACLIFQ